MCSNHWVMNCKQETYKRLGDYIREVDVRNNENKLSENDLYGVSVTKEFIPTHANLVGVQFHNYKVVKQKQFTYIPDTSRRGDKIALALNLFGKEIIVSNVYTTFEVDENQLLPEYLMMWFRRSEFDRYARFKSHGSAREVFDWEEMCNVMLPIPAPIEQQRIVDQYNAIQKRIENNKQTIAKLEEAAQAIYNHTFVEGIDEENLPKGWEVTTMAQICDFAYGKMPKEEEVVDNGIPVYCGYAVTKYYKYASHTKKTIVVIARGDAGSGEVKMSPNEFFLSNLGIAIMPKDENLKWYLYYHLLTKDTYSLRTGSAQAQVTINSIEPFEVIIPPLDKIMYFSNIVESLSKYKDNLLSENSHLNSLLSLLTSKLS